MPEQRKVSRESFRRRKHELFWSPRVEIDGKLRTVTRIGKTEWYAAVDDIAEGTVVLQIASWPKLDKGNHLRFDEIYEQSYPLDALQQVVNRGRAQHGQPATDRPLRPGDAFLIQCEDRPGEKVVSPEFEGSVLDITAAAREQAKIAMYGIVSYKLSPTEAKNRQKPSKEPDQFQRIAGAREQLWSHSPGTIARPEV